MASRYVKGDQLGEGTWGNVFKATRRSDGLVVAIKRIKPMDPMFGINFTALREIKFLKEVKCSNIVDVRLILSHSPPHLIANCGHFPSCSRLPIFSLRFGFLLILPSHSPPSRLSPFLRYRLLQLKDVFISGGVLHMVMEFCPFDLSHIIQDKTIFLRSFHTKRYLDMILRGIDHLHKNFILHRGERIVRTTFPSASVPRRKKRSLCQERKH